MIRAVIGLGNPGERYQDTRHNFGQVVLSELSNQLNQSFRSWHGGQVVKYSSLECEQAVWLFIPGSYMNVSGQPIVDFLRYHDLVPEEIIIVHDDLDLAFGRIQRRFGGGTGGHHGVESVRQALGTADFWRLRMGIGRPISHREIQGSEDQVTSYVLGRFPPEERRVLPQVIDGGVSLLLESMKDSISPETKNVEISRAEE